MKFNRWLISACCCCLLLLLATMSYGQKGFTLISNTAQLQADLQKSAAKTQSLKSDFTQIKHMKMLDDKVRSKGTFHFKQTDKVRIEYSHPFSYLVVMNGSQLMIKEGGKISKINTSNSKTMQSVNKIMIDCMRGTVFQNKDFNIKAFYSNSQYLLQLSPVNSAMSGLFTTINIYLSKQDNSVDKLELKEKNGDYTEMIFMNKTHNLSLKDALFSVR